MLRKFQFDRNHDRAASTARLPPNAKARFEAPFDHERFEHAASAEPADVRSDSVEAAGETEPDRPVIEFARGERHALIRALREIAATDELPPRLFQYGGGLCRPHLSEATGFAGERVEVLELHRLSAAALADHLARRITVLREGRPYDLRESDAQIVLDSLDETAVPQVAAIAQTPVLDQSGDLQTGTRYLAARKLWIHAPNVDVPARPSQREVDDAYDFIAGWLDEFAFEEPTDYAAAMTLIFTACLRASVPHAPAFLISKPEFGAGASTLTKLAGVIRSGRVPAVTTLSRDDADELRKQIDSLQLAGRGEIVLDNVFKLQAADALAQLVTEPEREVRVLGQSKTARVPCTQLVVVNGCNVRIGDDMVRRVVPIRINPRCETPEARTFRRPNIVQDALRDRAKILGAILTVVRGYLQSGERVTRRPLAGFEGWCRLCVEPLIWCGLDDPLVGMDRNRADDPTRALLRQILPMWARAWGDAWVPAREVLAGPLALRTPKDPAAAAELVGTLTTEMARGHAPTAKQLGEFLRRHCDRVICGWVINRKLDPSTNAVLWRVSGTSGAREPLPLGDENSTRKKNIYKGGKASAGPGVPGIEEART